MSETAAYCLNNSNAVKKNRIMLPFVQRVYVFIMNVFMILAGSARPRWSFLAVRLAGGIAFSLSGT